MHLRYPFVEDPTEPGTDIKSTQFPIGTPEVLTAKSVIAAKNIKNFQLEGLTIDWPIEAVPEEWKIPVRIINGDFNKKFRYDYSLAKQTDLGIFWGENLNGGKLEVPAANASSASVKKIQLNASSIQVQ